MCHKRKSLQKLGAHLDAALLRAQYSTGTPKLVSESHLETHLKGEASHEDEVTDGDDVSQEG